MTRILSHQVYRRANQGLPARMDNRRRYKPNSYKRRYLKQAGEIQPQMTAQLENQVTNQAGDLGNFDTI